eukprot:1615341-Amphidinium_carterae.1
MSLRVSVLYQCSKCVFERLSSSVCPLPILWLLCRSIVGFHRACLNDAAQACAPCQAVDAAVVAALDAA